jgi:S1-C subfamily serine protease
VALILVLAALLITTLVTGIGLLSSERSRKHADRRAAKREQELSSALQAETAAVNGLSRRLGSLEAKIAAQPDLPTVAKAVSRSVYTLETADGLGTAFVLSSGGGAAHLVTDFHVVSAGWRSGHRDVTLRQEGRQLTGTIENVNEANDLAEVRVASELPALARATAEPTVGDTVLVVGAPLGLTNTVATGIVSAFRDGAIQFSAPISPGDSGGPVVDRSGKVIGVARSKLVGAGAEGLSFATPVTLICTTVVTC